MASNTSILNNTTMAASVLTNPHELALQSLCKQILKSRLFRGFYEERRYVENVKDYRDIVSLQKSEKELNKLVKDIRDKLEMFYSHVNPQMWIGVTCGPLAGTTPNVGALDTFIWAEMEDLAFGQYWFSIKTIKFRNNEVIIKLKTVRPVEAEEVSEKWTKSAATQSQKKRNSSSETAIQSQPDSTTNDTTAPTLLTNLGDNQVNLQDFAELMQQWWASTKQTVYDFMAKDISKENLKGVLRFLGLIIVSLLSGALMAVKFLGIFTLRFMFELSRLTHVLTPIIMKIIDVFNKIVGGFYILLAMIWKDAVVNRNQTKNQPALEYNRPMYRSIEYDIRQRRQQSSSPMATEFGRADQ